MSDIHRVGHDGLFPPRRSVFESGLRHRVARRHLLIRIDPNGASSLHENLADAKKLVEDAILAMAGS